MVPSVHLTVKNYISYPNVRFDTRLQLPPPSVSAERDLETAGDHLFLYTSFHLKTTYAYALFVCMIASPFQHPGMPIEVDQICPCRKEWNCLRVVFPMKHSSKTADEVLQQCFRSTSEYVDRSRSQYLQVHCARHQQLRYPNVLRHRSSR